eukprot:Gb_41767 [translate_table: standard]
MGWFRNPKLKEALENEALTLKGVPPKDRCHLAYIIHILLGAAFMLPWNVFVTAVDYFSYFYPGEQVDRVFAVVYIIPSLVFIIILTKWAGRCRARVRINLGIILSLLTVVVVPVTDVAYIKGRRGLYGGYYITVAAVAFGGIADAFMQGSLIGSAGELPQQYMQAVVAGTAISDINECKDALKAASH